MSKATIKPLFSWRAAICDSDLRPVVRHVCLTLSLYMSERGDSAFPGASRLARDTGLAKRTVHVALTDAVKAGWLTEKVKGCSLPGGRRIATEYVATIPTGDPESLVSDDHQCISRQGLVILTTPTSDPGSTHLSSNSPPNSPSLSSVNSSTGVDNQAERGEVVDRALTIIATNRVRRARRRGVRIDSATAYTARVLADVAEELGDELTKRAANPAFTAEDLASMFERPLGYEETPPEPVEIESWADRARRRARSEDRGPRDLGGSLASTVGYVEPF